ncbi:hypothetical protein E3U44_06060 [Nitrosococcus wardiae]|uniref:1-acyl-sn-glycerol-3-phosphate acyltransferase n=1 Tax=Nitrosococcus wardiae TaxID=1814290 RepID=A0A4P7BY72_9GAMM|nr:hypothetical protein E3U44_06060 [Nitrosococcus wardiae]
MGICLAVVVLSPGGFRWLPRRSTIRWWNCRLCRILRLRVQVSGRPVIGTALLVANHISWLDVIALLAVIQVR